MLVPRTLTAPGSVRSSLGDGLTDRLGVRSDPRSLGDDDRVDVADAPPSLGGQGAGGSTNIALSASFHAGSLGGK